MKFICHKKLYTNCRSNAFSLPICGDTVNPFQDNVPFYPIPLKVLNNRKFSGAFRGNKKRILT